jgi:hypothetical protein
MQAVPRRATVLVVVAAEPIHIQAHHGHRDDPRAGTAPHTSAGRPRGEASSNTRSARRADGVSCSAPFRAGRGVRRGIRRARAGSCPGARPGFAPLRRGEPGQPRPACAQFLRTAAVLRIGSRSAIRFRVAGGFPARRYVRAASASNAAGPRDCAAPSAARQTPARGSGSTASLFRTSSRRRCSARPRPRRPRACAGPRAPRQRGHEEGSAAPIPMGRAHAAGQKHGQGIRAGSGVGPADRPGFA